MGRKIPMLAFFLSLKKRKEKKYNEGIGRFQNVSNGGWEKS
jgi:hypothetical protein